MHPDLESLERAMNQVGGKWKLLIIAALLNHSDNKVLRFNELKRVIEGVTQRMLSLQLKEMQADGLVEKKVFAVVPPKVEYRLTERGEALAPVLSALQRFGAGCN